MADKDQKKAAEDEEIVEFKPDFSLKEKIGVNINEILTSEVINSSQEVINKSQKDFLKWVTNDLQTLENAYKELAKDPAKGRDAALEIQKAAFSCKAQAGTFGYDLGSAVAKSLYDFLENDYVEGESSHVIIIRKHIDTLNTIFSRDVAGDGGKIGSAVYTALGKLITKFEVRG
jgi:chemotaxis protein histidine kinase CheA